MNLIKSTIPALILGGILMGSCKKSFLDLKPYNQVASDIAITNETDMQAAVNGAYAALRDVDLFGRTIPLIGDLMSDNVYIAVVNSNRYLQEFNYSYLNTHANSLSTWSDAYNGILRANNIIHADIPATAVSNQLKGEALTLRALQYFYLVNIWGQPFTVDPNAEGVPIVLEYDPILKPARNKVSEVYTQIEKDLADAYELMTNTSKNSSYATKYVARALQARVALFKGDWNTAKIAAQDVVTNGGYTLTASANYVNYWKSPTPVSSKVETIFEITNDAVANGGFDALAYFYDATGYGDAIAADALYNLYSATDVRRNVMTAGTKGGQQVKFVTKYSNSSNAAEKDDTKIIRHAEVLLILAEALARTNDETNAKVYLNMVAQNRDPSFTGYTSTGTALIDDILLERRKELAFEGHRYWDLTRTKKDVVRVNLNGNYPSNTPLTLLTTSPKRLWAIPQSERDANPNISQNPGY
ncbi:MAG TPA: RagB/SusD family nutrient uptake outer membrane protein [Chitinophagaceae bacterium]|nr:RagB/SusD family nutrient uptake outer membrane protein [Chitinophagaceae bacterium]